MINVTNCSNITMWLTTIKFLFRHLYDLSLKLFNYANFAWWWG
jgi:hypothetical protein